MKFTFTETFNRHLAELNISDHDAAALLKTSTPTIERWKLGETIPFSEIQPLILEILKRALLTKEGQ